MRERFPCKMKFLFQDMGLKTADNTGLLYHSKRFDELIRIASYNPQFEFNGRSVVAISVTPFIRLLNRDELNQIYKADLDNIADWLNSEFP